MRSFGKWRSLVWAIWIMRTRISGDCSLNQSSGSCSRLTRVKTIHLSDSRQNNVDGNSTSGLLSTISWVSIESDGNKSAPSLTKLVLTSSMLRKLLHLPTDASISTIGTFLIVTLLRFCKRSTKLFFNEICLLLSFWDGDLL